MSIGDKCPDKENETEARQRVRAFWNNASLGRPLLWITAAREGYAPPPFPCPELSPKERDLHVPYHLHSARTRLDGTLFLAEAFPGITVQYGSLLTITGVLAGGDFSYDGENAWFNPWPDILDTTPPAFTPEHPIVRAMETIYAELAQTVGKRAHINPPILLDGLTTLSMLRTPEALCLDLIENPESVLAWAKALDEIGIELYKHFYGLLRKNGYTDTSSWLPLMAEGTFEAMQCDFGVMISPEMFEAFALPGLRRATDYFDFSVYHLDGTCQLRFLDLLRTLPRLKGIQWNPEPSAGQPTAWIESFREIRERGFTLLVHARNVEEAVALAKALGPDGLAIALPHFKNRADAEKAIQEIEQASRL